MPYTSNTVRSLAITTALGAAFGASAIAQVAPTAGAIFATVDIPYIAKSSKAGKAALAKLEEAGRQKEIEAAAKAADVRKQQAALQPDSAMSDRARADLQKAFERSRTEFERFRQDAQTELQGMQAQFEADFRLKLIPIVDQISKEKGFHFVFGLEQSTLIVWANPALDISEEVVRRLDAERQ